MMIAVLALAFAAFVSLVAFISTGGIGWLVALFVAAGIALALLVIDIMKKKE